MDETGLSSEEFGALFERRIYRWLFDAFRDWFLILCAFGIAGALDTPFAYVLAAFIIGNRQHALAVLGHDGAHSTICNNRRWNDGLTGLCFWPLWVSIGGYRRFHFAHHRHTGGEGDPELMLKRRQPPQWDLPISKIRLARYLLLDLVGGGVAAVLDVVIVSKPENIKDFAPVLMVHLAAICLLSLFGLLWAYAFWHVCLLTTFWFFFRLRGWTEHQGTRSTHRLTFSRWQRAIFLPHNVWLHWEHHQYAAIPYHRLEELRVLLRNGPPVMRLAELIEAYRRSAPIPSGGTPV